MIEAVPKTVHQTEKTKSDLTEKVVKNDDLKTPILDIVEGKLTSIETKSTKSAKKITSEDASKIASETSAKTTEKPQTTAQNDINDLLAPIPKKVEKEAEEKAKEATDLKAKIDSEEKDQNILHWTVERFSAPGLNLGLFSGIFASFCLSLFFSFFPKSRKKTK